jgi:hypothetical protein
MTGTFRPEIWSQAIIDDLRLNILYPGRRDERRRQGHTVRTPYSKAELKARKKALKAWQALTDELLAKGWLEDYPDDGIIPSTETEHREWVYDETEQEYQARLATLEPPETTPATRAPLNDNSIRLLNETLNTES